MLKPVLPARCALAVPMLAQTEDAASTSHTMRNCNSACAKRHLPRRGGYSYESASWSSTNSRISLNGKVTAHAIGARARTSLAEPWTCGPGLGGYARLESRRAAGIVTLGSHDEPVDGCGPSWCHGAGGAGSE